MDEFLNLSVQPSSKCSPFLSIWNICPVEFPTAWMLQDLNCFSVLCSLCTSHSGPCPVALGNARCPLCDVRAEGLDGSNLFIIGDFRVLTVVSTLVFHSGVII